MSEKEKQLLVDEMFTMSFKGKELNSGTTQVNTSHSSESELTESEIREWGYDPEMFDKEEVK